MDLLILTVISVAVLYSAMSIAYGIGKRRGCRNCAPEVERAYRYRDAVDSLDRWCGHESPQARLIATHLLSVGEGLAMNAGTPCGDEPCTISGLRDHLRRASLNAEDVAEGAKCHCDKKGIGRPGVTCGDCPRDYK